MKPSELLILDRERSRMAFGDCLGKLELEQAAALLVLACAQNGDRWGEQSLEMVQTAIGKAVMGPEPCWLQMVQLPVFRPDFPGLHERGLVTRVDREVSFELQPFFELTELGLRLLEHPGTWVQWRRRAVLQ